MYWIIRSGLLRNAFVEQLFGATLSDRSHSTPLYPSDSTLITSCSGFQVQNQWYSPQKSINWPIGRAKISNNQSGVVLCHIPHSTLFINRVKGATRVEKFDTNFDTRSSFHSQFSELVYQQLLILFLVPHLKHFCSQRILRMSARFDQTRIYLDAVLVLHFSVGLGLLIM